MNEFVTKWQTVSMLNYHIIAHLQCQYCVKKRKLLKEMSNNLYNKIQLATMLSGC